MFLIDAAYLLESIRVVAFVYLSLDRSHACTSGTTQDMNQHRSLILNLSPLAFITGQAKSHTSLTGTTYVSNPLPGASSFSPKSKYTPLYLTQ